MPRQMTRSEKHVSNSRSCLAFRGTQLIWSVWGKRRSPAGLMEVLMEVLWSPSWVSWLNQALSQSQTHDTAASSIQPWLNSVEYHKKPFYRKWKCTFVNFPWVSIWEERVGINYISAEAKNFKRQENLIHSKTNLCLKPSWMNRS